MYDWKRQQWATFEPNKPGLVLPRWYTLITEWGMNQRFQLWQGIWGSHIALSLNSCLEYHSSVQDTEAWSDTSIGNNYIWGHKLLNFTTTNHLAQSICWIWKTCVGDFIIIFLFWSLSTQLIYQCGALIIALSPSRDWTALSLSQRPVSSPQATGLDA